MNLEVFGKSVDVYFAKYEEQLSDQMWDKYIQLMPKSLQLKNSKFRRWQDRHANLFGKLLLIKGLNKNGFDVSQLRNLRYNEFGRPRLEEGFDFNISHAGHYVVCAIANGIRLGVDVEEVHDVNFEDFKRVMTSEQWQSIKKSSDPTREFFRYWTIKESVIKADSRGMTIPLLDIHIKRGKVKYEHQIWHLNEFSIDENYYSCLATNEPSVTLNLEEINFHKNFPFPQYS